MVVLTRTADESASRLLRVWDSELRDFAPQRKRRKQETSASRMYNHFSVSDSFPGDEVGGLLWEGYGSVTSTSDEW